jgi:hypothetical protein
VLGLFNTLKLTANRYTSMSYNPATVITSRAIGSGLLFSSRQLRLKLPLTVLAFSILTACGGGGGGDPPPPPPPVNQPPVANNACVSTPGSYTAGGSITGMLPGSDPEGRPLTYAIPSLNSSIKSSSITTDALGNFSYIPATPGILGMDKFTYTVTDDGGLEASGTVWVFIGGTGNNPPPALRIMPLGDSITEGTTTPQPPDNQRVGYRQKLYNDLVTLANGKFTVDFVGGIQNGGAFIDPNHQGTPGQRDDELAANVGSYLNTNKADILLLHIGTNVFDPSAADVQTALNSIDSWEVGNLFPVTVFLAQIIDDIPNFGTELDVPTFNTNLMNMVATRPTDRLVLVDMHSVLNYGSGGPGPDMADNLHPTQAGYDKMATKWYDDLVTTPAGPKYLGLPQCP